MLLNASALEVRGGSLLVESFTRASYQLYSFKAVPAGTKTDCPPWYVEEPGAVSACMQVIDSPRFARFANFHSSSSGPRQNQNLFVVGLYQADRAV